MYVKTSTLKPCPDTPNCVSSIAINQSHYILPFKFFDSPVIEIKRLKQLLENKKNILVVSSTQEYLHAECKTSLFRFVDDLEFLWDPKEKVCQVRSASRQGYYDFGKNRKTVEYIRKLFYARVTK